MALKRRRYRSQEMEEDALQLGDVLEPYDDDPFGDEAFDDYDDPPPTEEEDAVYQDMYTQPAYEEEYEDEDEQEAEDSEGNFRIAMGVFDVASILVGAVTILVLVALLVTLAGWLKTDILHSALLLQSGLQ